MKRLISDRRWIGILVAIPLMALFIGISLFVNQFLHGAPWFLFSSALRIVFGIAMLFIAGKLYGWPPKEILSFRNSKTALAAGTAFLGYFLFFLIDMAAGIKAFSGFTFALFFTKVILQQAATGFYEEAHYRLLVCEGYFHGERTAKKKLLYAAISAVIFGGLHVVTGWDEYRFILTGSIGFAFAAMFLNSRNIVIPMILHAIYDIVANLESFIEWNQSGLFQTINSALLPAAVIMAVISAVMLFKAHPSSQKDPASKAGTKIK